MNFNNKNAEIITHVGNMFGGKTTALLADIRKCLIANLNVVLFKPSMDDRYSDNKVISHDGISVECINVTKLSEIKDYIQNNKVDVIAIDEFQFIDLDIDLKEFLVKNIFDKKKKLIVSGLKVDSDLNIFDNISKIMSYASTIYEHKSICKKCLEPAYTIYCTVPKTGQVLIGGEDIYIPVCLSCYKELSEDNK
jgi:thymidine kinase